jgi:hypothetical protein
MARGSDITARVASAVLAEKDKVLALGHPIAEAYAITLMIESLTEIIADLKATRRDSLAQAYELGQSKSGWYGYGAIAEQIGLSTSRVRQILFDVNEGQARDDSATQLREHAVRCREAVKLLKKGVLPKEVARVTGLPVKEVKTLSAELHHPGT